MQQTLGRYVTPTASKTLSDLYNRISQAYSRRPGDESLQANLDNVKKTLADGRRASALKFLCFKQTKTQSSKSGRSSAARKRVRETPSRELTWQPLRLMFQLERETLRLHKLMFYKFRTNDDSAKSAKVLAILSDRDSETEKVKYVGTFISGYSEDHSCRSDAWRGSTFVGPRQNFLWKTESPWSLRQYQSIEFELVVTGIQRFQSPVPCPLWLIRRVNPTANRIRVPELYHPYCFT